MRLRRPTPTSALDRRGFGRLLALSGLAVATGGTTAGEVRRTAATRALPLVKPPRLAAGDRVGLVLPASMEIEPSRLELAREQLAAIGFEPVLGEHVAKRRGYLAGTDRERAEDVNRMFADPEVRGVFCYSGGWGSPRVLPHLDYDLIRRHPKPLVGYSDNTALINAVHAETGLVTFHGPNAAGHLEPWTLERFRRALMSTEPIGVLANPPKRDDELVPRFYRAVTIAGGRARGRLVGGNLTLVAALMGTPWEVDTRGAILLLEDIHEEPYRIDRMLTQLAQSGKLAAAAGVAFGFCTDCPVRGPSLGLEEVLADHLGPLGVPALSGLAFGHVEKKLTLPLGLEATLDADAGTLTIDEAAVV